MDEWLFWEQYSHEPYIAVCRFQMFYLGKPASDLDPDKVKRGYAALARMEHQLAITPFLVGDAVTLADISLLAYTRLAHEGGFRSRRLRRGAALDRRDRKIPRPAAGALTTPETVMSAISEITIRRARREDVGRHRRHAGGRSRSAGRASGSRTRCRNPISRRSSGSPRDPNIQLVVAEDGEGAVVGCLQLCILPGLSSQGASRGLIEDVRVASHCRSRGIGEQMVQWAVAEARAQGLQAGRTADASHPRRCATVLRAARLCAQPCRHDVAILTLRRRLQRLSRMQCRSGSRHYAIRLTTDKLRARPGFYGPERLRYAGVSHGARAAWGFPMKKYSIVRIGSEYVVQAGETSILKVASRREAAKLVTDAAELAAAEAGDCRGRAAINRA